MNEFSRRDEDTPGDFPEGGSRLYAAQGSRKIEFDPLEPTRRELEGFIRNLRTDPRITDAWLTAYLADPAEVHPAFESAVKAEIERRVGVVQAGHLEGRPDADKGSAAYPQEEGLDVDFPDEGSGR